MVNFILVFMGIIIIVETWVDVKLGNELDKFAEANRYLRAKAESERKEGIIGAQIRSQQRAQCEDLEKQIEQMSNTIDFQMQILSKIEKIACYEEKINISQGIDADQLPAKVEELIVRCRHAEEKEAIARGLAESWENAAEAAVEKYKAELKHEEPKQEE